MAEGVCAGCGKEEIYLKAKGYCRACYQQWKRTGSTVRERMPRGQCTIPGCEKKAHGRGVCDMHIKRMRVSGSYDDPRADNINLKSNQAVYVQWQSYTRPDGYPMVDEWRDFPTFFAAIGNRPSRNHRLLRLDKTKPMGPGNFEWREKFTQRAPGETTAEYNNRYRKVRKEVTGSASWDGDLKKKYGPDFGRRELLTLYEAQNGLCPICHNVETARDKYGRIKMMAVEHDHRTGKIRSLACQACNAVIGYAMDDIRILQSAIDYLTKHDAQPGETRFRPVDDPPAEA